MCGAGPARRYAVIPETTSESAVGPASSPGPTSPPAEQLSEPRGVERMADRVSRRQVLIGGLSVAGAAVATPVLAQTAFAGSGPTAAAVSPDDLPWAEAKKIVAETKVPSFPNAVFNVMRYGAKNDG